MNPAVVCLRKWSNASFSLCSAASLKTVRHKTDPRKLYVEESIQQWMAPNSGSSRHCHIHNAWVTIRNNHSQEWHIRYNAPVIPVSKSSNLYFSRELVKGKPLCSLWWVIKYFFLFSSTFLFFLNLSFKSLFNLSCLWSSFLSTLTSCVHHDFHIVSSKVHVAASEEQLKNTCYCARVCLHWSIQQLKAATIWCSG